MTYHIRGIHDYIEYLPDLTRFCWSNYTCSYRPICLVKKRGDPQSSPRLSIHFQGLWVQIMVKHEKLWSGLRLPGWWILMDFGGTPMTPWLNTSMDPPMDSSSIGSWCQSSGETTAATAWWAAERAEGKCRFSIFASKMRDVTNKLLEYSIVFYWYYNS
jgi:hypothetical protein